MFAVAGISPTYQQQRDNFLSRMLNLSGDVRLLWTPKPADTTTSVDETLSAATLTHDATIASRLAQLGLGYYTTFDGVNNWAKTPDNDRYSPGNGTTDKPVSMTVLANVTDSAAIRYMLTKGTNAFTQLEYIFYIDAADKLNVTLADQSTSSAPSRLSDAAITQGSWRVFSFTYSAATGGATAATDITLYQDGQVIASTATNSGTYIAMENLTQQIAIAVRETSTNPFLGSMAYVDLEFTNLSAQDHWNKYKELKGYFGL